MNRALALVQSDAAAVLAGGVDTLASLRGQHVFI